MFFIAKKPERVKNQAEPLSESVETTTLSYFTLYWDKCTSRKFAVQSGLLSLFFMALLEYFHGEIFSLLVQSGCYRPIACCWSIRDPAYVLSKGADFVLMEVIQFFKKMKQKINIDERNRRTLRGGRFGALSTRNLFHFRFPLHKVWELGVQIHVDSTPIIGYKIQTDRQSILVDSFPSHIALGGELPKLAEFTLC